MAIRLPSIVWFLWYIESWAGIDHKNTRWENRAHFYAVATQRWRGILVDHARSRGYAKRGARALKVSFDEAVIGAEQRGAELIAFDKRD